MKLSILAVAAALSAANAAPVLEERASVTGFDISHYQPNVDFKSAYSSGARFVIIKVPLPSSPLQPSQNHPSKPTNANPPTIGNRRHQLHRPQLLRPLHRRHKRRLHPGRLPLRAPRLLLRRDTGKILRRPRRRLVGRRHYFARDAGHRVRAIGQHVLRAQRVGDGLVDFRLCQHVPLVHGTLADDLFD